jgi:flagellar basal-body rod protein FlgC
MSLFNLLSVSASGLEAQRVRAEQIVSNLANLEVTNTPDGGPYKRRDVVMTSGTPDEPFSAVFQNEMDTGATGVSASQIVEDSRPPDLRYLPGHPDADAKGYVAFPHISAVEEMADLMGTSRGFDANVTAMTAIKDMVSKSIDLLKI